MDRAAAKAGRPLTDIRLIAVTKIFPFQVILEAYDAGLRELAVIVENRHLQQALWDGVRTQDARVFCPAGWTALEFGADCATLR